MSRGFHGSDREPPGQKAQGSSDHDVDVETVETGTDFLSGPEEAKRPQVINVGSSSQPAGQSDAEVSDSHLLASILGDLQVVTQPKRSSSSSFEGRPSPVAAACDPSTELNLPPLLRQVSPVRSYSRNTPPPLRRSDAPSPRPWHPDAGAAGCSTPRSLWSAPRSSQGASLSASRLQEHSFVSSPAPRPEDGELLAADLQGDSPAGFPSAPGQSVSTQRRNAEGCSSAGNLPASEGSSGVNYSHAVSDPLGCGPDAPLSPAEANAPAQPPHAASALLVMATNFRSFSSDLGCRSSQNPSSSASGGDLRDASASGHEDPPPAAFQKTSRLKCSAAPPFVPHTALSSSASSNESKVTTDARPDLLADTRDTQPAVEFH